ncbi:coA-transferase III family protein [Mycobacterium kansasii 732]|uniref:Acetyl-CoA:oxalate CoA-transferase n=1 Tax=Mycobacterium pseudokansasii TaxID=2341080 RepID=A0A498QHN8_9MYCO|nr:CoA transferase [Mycobacterium pseudokansasii]EUA15111.1 coA-transferase III family protein [Mycobacterium kansasii 732]MBY0387057.1 CoA transferase [Mycobacterium pseudokansasii]VAZ87521.1 Acetyl-CoA:oxalate CoA-transferase [Mycobacterium pseudokansasii]VAZ87912.1 Acetyl-CoA:oxalate CoA-transferase [Mycobacterium pseudokansasii]VBA45789.1 Acetyl-CoA:oxalate CoA-transferase [Mycobacterium pseudokansasii]
MMNGSVGQPLSSLLVADFSRVLAGPFCTMTLGDLGAEIVKIEPPGGDDTRAWGPPFVADQSAYYLSVNRNKRSIVLDLRDAEDLRVARALAERADVLVENFRPGTMARFGLDEPVVRAANPALVYCSISAFGTAAGRELAGYDLLVQALGGLMSITGADGDSPTKVGAALVDVLAGLFATVGILAALRERDRSGCGQHVEINLMSALLAAMANQSAGFVLAEQVPRAMGNGHASIAPYDSYPTGDGTIVLAVGNDKQFGRLCEALGIPGLARDARFATNESRVRNRALLREHLEGALATESAEHWTKTLPARGIPAGAVNNIAEAVALAERLGLHPIRDTEDGDALGRQVASPIKLSATPVTYRTRAPRLGEHSNDIRARVARLKPRRKTA